MTWASRRSRCEMKMLWLPFLFSSFVWAERQYFLQSFNCTWDMARNHCDACFKDLAPLTSLDADFITKHIVNDIVKNLTSEQWIGLRYNATIPSFSWSNEEPVTYQNWFPGHPVANKVKKMIQKCFTTTENPTTSQMTTTQTSTVTTQAPVTSTEAPSCQSNKTDEMCPVILFNVIECLNMTYKSFECAVQKCTCDAGMTTDTPKTTILSSTASTIRTSTLNPGTSTDSGFTESTTDSNSNCILEPEPDREVYIEDACVALLGFGMWKEKNCNESLPFICYDERFIGEIHPSNMTTSSANVSWSKVPDVDNIESYRVELTGDVNQTHNETNMSILIQNLNAGKKYKVQVIPVRCGRDLNPQITYFYTIPSGIRNLTVISVTTESVYLNWTNPDGGFDFFSVDFNSSKHNETQTKTTFCNITGLDAGIEYTFTVKGVVNRSTYGVPMSVTNYTKPSTVSNVLQTSQESTSITATWNNTNNLLDYCYCLDPVVNNINCINCNLTNCTRTQNSVITETNKLTGTKYLLCVAAVTKSQLMGEMIGILTYTIPNSVNLTLNPTNANIYATWTISGNYEHFSVTIESDSTSVFPNIPKKIYERTFSITPLLAGVNYTVTVITVNGDLKSKATKQSVFTKPVPPGDVTAKPGKMFVYLSWSPPEASKQAKIKYIVSYNTAYWNESNIYSTYNTFYNITDLRSGTVYNFNVLVKADDLESDPTTAKATTEPNKRTLTIAMLCSSETPLNCDTDATKNDLLQQVSKQIGQTLDGVHWKATWVKRN